MGFIWLAAAGWVLAIAYFIRELLIERRSRTRFLEEAPLRHVVLREVGGKNLDRDAAAETSVAGAVHDSHAAGTERGFDLVGA